MSCNNDLEGRFPHQAVVYHAPDYVPTPTDRAAAGSGEAFLIRGNIVAAVEYVCRRVQDREAFWYYAARPGDPVICDLVLPRQSVSACHCRVEGQDVLKAGRMARERGLTIVSAGHSHGGGAPYSSGTDKNQMIELVAESVGVIAEVPMSLRGLVTACREQVDGQHAVEARFPDCDCTVTVTVKSSRATLTAEDLDVQLNHPVRRTLSIFTTSNRYGEHFVPVHETHCCSVCRAKQMRYLGAGNVTVHVIGPIALSREARRMLRREVRDRVTVRTWYESDEERSVCEEGEYLKHDDVAAN